MIKIKKLLSMLTILILLSQLLPGFMNTAYAANNGVDIIFDSSRSWSNDWSYEGAEKTVFSISSAYDSRFYTDDIEWTNYFMENSTNHNTNTDNNPNDGYDFTNYGFAPVTTDATSTTTRRYLYIDLGSIADEIDKGDIYYKAMLDMGNNSTQVLWYTGGNDTMKLIISYCDENKGVIGSKSVTKNVPYKTWENNVTIGQYKLPEGTRYIKYEIETTDDSGNVAGNYSIFANPRLYIYDKQGPKVKQVIIDGTDASVISVNGQDTIMLEAGEYIDLIVEFNEPVVIQSNLALILKYDDGNPDTNDAIYSGASCSLYPEDIIDGGRKYIFHGRVPSDIKDNMYLQAESIEFLNSDATMASIQDYCDNNILTLSASMGGKPVMIDSNNPEIENITSTSGNGIFTTGENIGFKAVFSETVDAFTDHKLVFNNGLATAKYQSGSGTDTIYYTYTVADGDDIANLKVTHSIGTVTDITGKTLTNAIPAQSYLINIDTQDPEITFTDVEGGAYNDSSTYKQEHQVYITVTDDVSGPDDIYYYWDTIWEVDENVNWDNTNTITNGTVPVVNPEKASGENYYLHSKATDNAGNTLVKTKGPFYFDNENPTVTLNPSEGINQTSYNVTITAEDEKAGIKDINYTWYRIIDAEGNSETMNSGTIESGANIRSPDMDATYQVIVEAEDNAGNTESKASGNYSVDKTHPTVVFSTSGSDNGIKAASVDVTISDENAVKSGCYQWSESVIKPAEDDSSWTVFFTDDGIDPVSVYTETISSVDGENGIWYLHVKCEDTTGNVGIYTTGNGFKLDNEEPDLSFSPNGNSSPNQEFDTYLQINNENFGYTVKYEISKDSTSTYDDEELTEYILNGDEIAFAINSNTGENKTDTYYIHAKVEDSAGNISTYSSSPIYIDNTPPVGSIYLNDSYTNQSSVQLNLLASDTYPEGASEDIVMHISSDGGVIWGDWIAYSQAQSLSLSEEKTYNIAVQYKDSAGNKSEMYTCQTVYDKTSPEIESIQYNNEWTNEDLPVTIFFSDVTDTEEMDIEVIDGETTSDVSVKNNVITFKQNGVCSFKYRDLAGNENTGSITVSNFDKTAPVISLSPDGNSNESQSVTTQVSVTDNVTAAENIEIYYCWAKSSSIHTDNWTLISDGIIEKADGNGKWYLWIKAIDSLGNISIFTSRDFNLDNESPKTSNITYSPSSITANNVTAKIVFTEDVKMISPISTSEYFNSFEYTFSDNKAVSIVFSDVAGNENSCILEVDWIDRTLPSAEESYSLENWTNEPIEVTVTADDEQYSLYNFKPYIDDKRAFIKAGNSDSTVAECVYNWNNDSGVYLVGSDNSNQTVSEYVYDNKISLLDVTVNSDGAVTQAKFEFEENGYMNYKIMKLDTGLTGDGNVVVDKIDMKKPSGTLSYISGYRSWDNNENEEWTNENVEVTIKTSDNSGQPVEILNNNGSDKYIFEERGEFDFRLRDSAGNENTVTASVYKIDRQEPVAHLIYSSGDKSWTSFDGEEWTNKNVEVTIKTSDNSGQPVLILNNEGSNKYTFTENGSFTFKIKDIAGNENEITAKVNRIDKKAPNAIIAYNTQEWTNGNVSVSISFDNETEDVIILNNGGSNEYTFMNNGAFKFEFKDIAGNKDEITIAVNNIDRVVPQVDELWYSNTEPTNGKVIVKVYTDENVDFLTDNGADNYTFEDNGSHEFRFVDRAGNENSTTAQVNNIDKAAPNVWIEYSTTDPTKDDVIVTLKADEEINVINNLNKNQYIFTDNGTFTFIYEDLAGNGGEIIATVENIDTTLPTITLEYSESELTQNDVTVTITSDKEITPVNYDSNTITFTDNETKWLKALDPFGEEFYFEVEVSNIDREVPKIEFTKGENLIIKKGSSFNPLIDVLVTDNLDEEISTRISVANNVEVNAEGEYQIIYSVTDCAGNSIRVTRKAIVVDPNNFTAFINSSEARTGDIVTQGQGISLEIFGVEGNHIVKWLEGKKSKGDFKGREQYCEGGYIDIEESGYYTLLIQDQERNTKLVHIYVIYSN